MERSKSQWLFSEAQKYIPGGVNSPVRAYKGVGGEPLFIKQGKGSKIFDVDGNSFIDYVLSWGPLILGHAHPEVLRSVRETIEAGMSFGAPTELELELAKMVVEAVPSVEMVRMVSSGTEAVMSAIRLARGFTGRDKIVKFEGCYHGHSDSLLIKAGSGVLTLGIPGTPGVTRGTAQDTILLPYNNLEAVKEVFEKHSEEIAAVIVEPVAGNMGVVLPKPGFLEGLRELTSKYGSVLIFDEVITGFRVSYGGAQELFGVQPDLTTLGKVLGGGMPVGAFGGKKEIMEKIAPTGPVYQAGTLSGNPVAMAAGIATLKVLQKPGFYSTIEEKAKRLREGLTSILRELDLGYTINSCGSMMCLFFTEEEVIDFRSASTSKTELYSKYFWKMMEQGVYLAPSQFEAAFLSIAHTTEDIDFTLEAAERSLREVKIGIKS